MPEGFKIVSAMVGYSGKLLLILSFSGYDPLLPFQTAN
jgi:hypothetical protein